MQTTKITTRTKAISKSNTYTLTLAALFAALACIGTLIIQIPTPTNGYVNVGDCFVILSGLCLGPVYGGIAAGLGSMMADIISGYIIFAPATFIIKGLMAVCAFYIFRLFASKFKVNKIVSAVLCSVVSEIIMISGYFVFEALIIGYGLGAAAGIASNAVQGLFAVIIAPIVYNLIFKNPRISIYRH